MSDIDSKKFCKAVCTPSLDGFTPNYFYEQGYCPPYMQQQCNADGSMFEEQWEKHQEDIKHYNAVRMFSKTMGFNPVPYTRSNDVVLPPTTATLMPAYPQRQVQYYEPIKTPKKVNKKKVSKKVTKKKSGKKK